MEAKVALAGCSLASAMVSDTSYIEELYSDVALRAIRSLGPLFKVTEVFLRDGAPVDNIEDLSIFFEEQILNGGLDLMKNPMRSPQESLAEAIEPVKKILLPGMVEELSVTVIKYWCQRYQLFSRFDRGAILDEEGWFSVTPEILAKHHAARSGTGTVIDCFTGMGGNAIQFAERSNHVIAIDINPKKIEYARHNAKIYGVDDRIDFITGDFFQLAPSLKADVVFLSPPWGGPDYVKVKKYDIQYMLKPKDGFSLFKAAQMIAPNIIIFLPKNVDLNQLAELSLLSHPSLALEVEKNYVNGNLKAITAYYSDINQSTIWPYRITKA